MQFFDQVYIDIESGKGGDGIIAGRREKHVQYGGPSGGDGGKGGDVIFVGDENEWTLMRYRYQTMFKAQSGDPGGTKQEYGKHGEDLYIPVPVGTIVREYGSGVILGSIQKHGEHFLCLPGGAGGVGNMHFTTSTNQYPQIALLGEPNFKKKVLLELQLLADVALIGTPSVGKSTLINAISNAKAKTAEYHFTTLVPNLGVVDHKGKSFHVIDIPGLIAGAAGGKGLGNEFLRHILKARALCFLVDASLYENGRGDFQTLMGELNEYVTLRYMGSQDYGSSVVEVRPGIVFEKNHYTWKVTLILEDGQKILWMHKHLLRVISKSDIFGGDTDMLAEYKAQFEQYLVGLDIGLNASSLGQHIYPLSAFTRDGVTLWLDTVRQYVDEAADESLISPETMPTVYNIVTTKVTPSCVNITSEALPRLIEQGYLDEDEAETGTTKVWNVVHADISRLTAVLPRGNDESELRYRRTLEKEGYLDRLRSFGADFGDIIKMHSVYRDTHKWILRE